MHPTHFVLIVWRNLFRVEWHLSEVTIINIKGTITGFPLGLENLENGSFQSGKSRGILNRLQKSRKSHKILDNSEFQTSIICYFLVIAK